MRFSFVRPDFAFVSVWLLTVVLYFAVDTPLNPPFTPQVSWMLGFNIVTAPLIFLAVRYALRDRGGERSAAELQSLDPLDITLIRDFTGVLFVIWCGVYAIMVGYSGGFPLIWYLLGMHKSYLDFAVPSVGGLNNMIRNFMGVVWMYLFCVTKQKRYLVMALSLISLFVLEMTRGEVFVYGLNIGCVYLLMNRLRFRTVLLVIFLGVAALALFVLMGSIRGIKATADDFGAGEQMIGALPAGFFWIWTYIVTPLGNVNYAAKLGIVPHYLPIEMLTVFLPTAVKRPLDMMNYAIPLVSSGYNAVSAYAPLVQDYGFAGGAALMAMLQVIWSYVYVRARQGSIMHILIYPPLFISIVLSVFWLYVANMTVAMYPFLCLVMKRYVRRHKALMGVTA